MVYMDLVCNILSFEGIYLMSVYIHFEWEQVL